METLKGDNPYLHGKGSQNDGAEDGVGKYAVKDVSLSVDLASVDLVEELHEDEGVEDDGVVLRGRGVERGVAAAVDVKNVLAWWRKQEVRKKAQLSAVLYTRKCVG